MQKLAHQIHTFDNFTLDLTRGCLLHDGEEIKLRPQTFATLTFLVENSGRLISKEELIKAVWPDWNASANQISPLSLHVALPLGEPHTREVIVVPALLQHVLVA